ncbi:TapB family protein [Terrimonas alba]|uniref:TapB family protein n=1 Tax=Terrimonas alba TaxID=3349636 RepID=UPI0035F40423
MKYFLSMLLLCLAGNVVVAQTCKDYYYLQNNKTIEMTIYNKKGKVGGKMTYAISDVSTAGGTTTATVNSDFTDTKGKTISKASNRVSCTGGVLMMDMKMFIPSAQQQQMGNASASASNVFIEYPSNMKEGDALKDGRFSMDFKMESGLGGNVSIVITDRKVAGKESINTPAGTWEAYKITYQSKTTMKIGIGIPINMDVTEWYVPGFGVVKTESGGGKTEITAIR